MTTRVFRDGCPSPEPYPEDGVGLWAQTSTELVGREDGYLVWDVTVTTGCETRFIGRLDDNGIDATPMPEPAGGLLAGVLLVAALYRRRR